MNINNWAERWAIPAEALRELQEMAGAVTVAQNKAGTSEAANQNATRLAAAKNNCRLMRNNVGAFIDDRGVPVRYGLANESKKMNKQIKSSDLIGIMPVTITAEMVGQIVGVFVARECKPDGWRYTGKEREKAQLAFIDLINSLGGDAKFCTGDF